MVSSRIQNHCSLDGDRRYDGCDGWYVKFTEPPPVGRSDPQTREFLIHKDSKHGKHPWSSGWPQVGNIYPYVVGGMETSESTANQEMVPPVSSYQICIPWSLCCITCVNIWVLKMVSQWCIPQLVAFQWVLYDQCCSEKGYVWSHVGAMLSLTTFELLHAADPTSFVEPGPRLAQCCSPRKNQPHHCD